jgi:hypothetical protein
MELYTRPYYNPYFVKVNGKEYEIGSIFVFDKDGNKASCNQGWFGSNNHCTTLTLLCGCVLKRKVDYSLGTAFIIKSGDGWDGPRYALYIPDSVVKLSAPTRRKVYNNEAIEEKVQSTLYPSIEFTKYHWINREVTSIKSEINSIGESIKNIYGSNIDTLPTHIEKLTSLYEQYKEAYSKMLAVDADEVR